MQLAEPAWSLYEFAEQITQVLALIALITFEDRPFSQVKHSARRDLFPNLPAGQSVHVAADWVSLNRPFVQATQVPPLVI